MAKIIGMANAKSPDKTLYDPTGGSGSLLLRAADESPKGVTIYGQEMDNATVALARMNMILHNNPTAEIWKGNTLAEDVLATFADAPLIDPYDVYQHVMTYWTDAMQDDVYILVAEGWAAGGKLRLIEEDKKEEADLKIGKLKYKADLIPPARSA